MNVPRSLQEHFIQTNETNHGLGITLPRPRTSNPRPAFVLPPSHQQKQLQPGANVSMRSQTGMLGLAGAELGANFLSLTPTGSGFKSGSAIAPGSSGEVATPSIKHEPQSGIRESMSLDRQPTLFTKDASRERKVAELKNVLGKSGRLDSKAKVLPSHVGNARKRSSSAPASPVVRLEKAKSRARVELDLLLDSGSCVEGGYVKGTIVVNVRSPNKKEGPIYLGGGKVRVVGFEAIPYNDERHVFYHCGAPLERVSPFFHVLYSGTPDDHAYYLGVEGDHNLPFAMRLPPRQTNLPVAKGVYNSRTNGSSIRYIAMLSLKIKHPITSKTSIAHIYRSIEIWPLFDPTIALLPTPQSLYATTANSLFLGGQGKLKLTASIHRATWVAGQRCYVKIFVANDTERKVQKVTLELIRDEIMFKPCKEVAVRSPGGSRVRDDMDACKTESIKRIVARNVLEMGEKMEKKHVTAKGWWTGVENGSSLEFNHYILLPAFALSIPRSRLIEVNYMLQIGVGTGPLSSDVTVQLPIRIINHISLDPPPCLGPLEKLRNLPSNSSRRSSPVESRSCTHAELNDNIGVDRALPNPYALERPSAPYAQVEDNGTYRGDGGMPAAGRLIIRNWTTPEVASSMGFTSSGFRPVSNGPFMGHEAESLPTHEAVVPRQQALSIPREMPRRLETEHDHDEGQPLLTHEDESKELDPAIEESNEGFVETECLAGHWSLRRSVDGVGHRREALGQSGFGQWRDETSGVDAAMDTTGSHTDIQTIERRDDELHYQSEEEVNRMVRRVDPNHFDQSLSDHDEVSTTDDLVKQTNSSKTSSATAQDSRPSSLNTASLGSSRATSHNGGSNTSSLVPSRASSRTGSNHSKQFSHPSESRMDNKSVDGVPGPQIGNVNPPNSGPRPNGARALPQRPRPQPIFMSRGEPLFLGRGMPVQMNRSRGMTLRNSVDLSVRQGGGLRSKEGHSGDAMIPELKDEERLEPNILGDSSVIDAGSAVVVPPEPSRHSQMPTSATMDDIPRTVSQLLAKNLKTPNPRTPNPVYSSTISEALASSETVAPPSDAPVFSRPQSVGQAPRPISTGLPQGRPGKLSSIQARIAMFEQRRDEVAPQAQRRVSQVPLGSGDRFKGGRL